VRSEQPQAPEAGVALAADHQVIVDGNAERLRRRLDLMRHRDVVAAGLGIGAGMAVEQSTLVQIPLSLPRLMRSTNSDGIAVWGMFLVRTRDFPRLTTILLRRLHSNTFEHGFRIPGLVYAVGPRSLELRSKRRDAPISNEINLCPLCQVRL